MRTLRILAALLRIRLTRRVADPMSFWTAFLVDTSVFAIQALVFLILYSNVDQVNGWGRWEAVFFVGTFTLIDALVMSTFFFGLIRLPETIRTGSLDLHLTRPADSLLRVSLDGADPGSLFIALPALGLLGSAAAGLGLRPGPATLSAYLAAVAMMYLLFYDLMVLIRVAAFRTPRISGLESLENVLVEMGFRLPGRVWQGGAKILFCVVLPYGLIATFPTEVFMGSAGAAAWGSSLGIVGVFTILARMAWKAGIRRYSGTGT